MSLKKPWKIITQQTTRFWLFYPKFGDYQETYRIQTFLVLGKKLAIQTTSLILLAKVPAPREIYISSIQPTFELAANLSFGVRASYIDKINNIFRHNFQHEADCNKVWRLRIWHVKGHLMVVKKWSPSTPLTEIDFSNTEFWIQVHDLASICMLKENAYTLGSLLGIVTDLDFSGDGNLIIERFLRMRVLININSNLLPGCFQIKYDNSLSWPQFSYERLTDI